VEVKWTLAAQAAASGLVGVVLVAGVRYFKKIRPVLTLPRCFAVFAGFMLAPSIPIFFIYPFVEPKPDLRDHAAYLLVAAIALGWLIYETFRLGVKPEAPAPSTASGPTPPSSPESSGSRSASK
jgi:hypothetical protein